MGLFSFLFGGSKYPSVAKYEAQRQQLVSDYERFNKIAQGGELKRLGDLRKETSASEFKQRVEKLKTERFSDTPEYKHEQELKSLLKSREYRDYEKLNASGKAKSAEATLSSAAYKEYQELLKKCESASVIEKAKKEKDSEEAKMLAKLKQLKKNSEFKAAEKLKASEAYANYKKVEGGSMLKKIADLKAEVESPAFKAKKADLEDKNRFKKSQECKALEELAALEKNADLRWYFATKEKNQFDELTKWTLSFSDEFKGSKLDNSKWSLGYYIGGQVGSRVYSLEGERQAFAGGNASVQGGLDIQTRVGKADGEVWRPEMFGFVKQTLDCTSALVTTGNAFKQKYGKFEFKVKAENSGKPVVHSIWMRSDKGSEIYVGSFDKKQVMMGSVVNKKETMGSVNDVKFGNDYYIYTLTWTQDKMTWAVNGVTVYETRTGVPQEEMYIGIGTNVRGEGNISNADLRIEWVKVYTTEKK